MRGRRLAPLAAALTGLPMAARAEGMPQLDFANPLTTWQVVWGAVIFVLLYILLAKWALPRIAGVLEMRATTIGKDLQAAQAAQEAADGAVAELTEATRKARASAQAEIAGAIAAAKEQAGAQAAALNAKLETQLAEAERRIATSRTAAMGALRQVASDTAGLVVSRLTGRPADPAALDHAIGAALAARGQG